MFMIITNANMQLLDVDDLVYDRYLKFLSLPAHVVSDMSPVEARSLLDSFSEGVISFDPDIPESEIEKHIVKFMETLHDDADPLGTLNVHPILESMRVLRQVSDEYDDFVEMEYKYTAKHNNTPEARKMCSQIRAEVMDWKEECEERLNSLEGILKQCQRMPMGILQIELGEDGLFIHKDC